MTEAERLESVEARLLGLRDVLRITLVGIGDRDPTALSYIMAGLCAYEKGQKMLNAREAHIREIQLMIEFVQNSGLPLPPPEHQSREKG